MNEQNISFQRICAPDNIHDEIVVNEYTPKGGWLEHYNKSGTREFIISALVGAAYVALMTLAYFWG